MKLKFKSEDDKDIVMTRLKKISVTDDYTVEERQEIRKMVEKAKEKNRNDTKEIVWKVRGTPKNGLELKWFPKRTQIN